MIKNDNILDELFRSKLNDFEEVPPSYVWIKIQEKQKAGKRERLLYVLRAAGIAAAVLLAFLAGWQLREQGQRPGETPVVAGSEHHDDQAPSRMQQEETGSAREITGGFVSGRETALAEAYVSKREARKAGAAPVEDVRKASEPADAGQSMNLMTMVDIKVETPELPDDLKKLVPGDHKEQSELTETDLRIIAMNKQSYERDKAGKNDKNWSIGAMVSPAFSVNQSSYDAAYASNMSRPGEKQNVTIGGGVTMEYKAGKRWSLQSGLHYSRLGQSSGTYGNNRSMALDHSLEYTYSNNNVQLEAGKLMMNASAGVVEIKQLPPTVRVSGVMESADASDELRLTNDNFNQRFEYIEIPLLVRYRLVDKIWNMEMLGGVSANMLVGNQVFLKDGGSETYIGETKDMNFMNYSASVGVGLGYRLTGKIRFNIEPQLKYYLQSLSSSPDVSFKPYSIGIYTGVSYRF